jgi:hypothetical protein
MPWVRSGYCCRCGQCCAVGGNPFPGDVEGNPRCSQLMATRQAEQPDACPLLHFHIGAPEGDTSCVGHGIDPYYLSGCIDWPSDPTHIQDYDRCTYMFTWVDGD